MLKHEQPKERIGEQAAAQVRVTPEELAAAVARLEARHAGADGKIAIGDAVNELSLDATSEEVLAEVRAGQVQLRADKTRRPLSLSQRLRLYFVAALLSVGMTALWARITAVPPTDPGIQTISPIASYTPLPQRIAIDPNLLVGDRTGKLVLLSEVSDNQPVHSNFYSGGFHQYSPGQGTKWTLIKHNGKVYVRGWIRKMSPAALAQVGADVSATGDSSFAAPVTLAVRGFAVSSSTPSYPSPDAAFHAQNITLDQHAYEKWNP